MSTTYSAFNYEQPGLHYDSHRRTDPRIAAFVLDALSGAETVLNIGAGAGSYEPADRYVTAVEPSAAMRARRIQAGRPPAVNASACSLPFDDDSFDASMAMVTVHHWPDIRKGLQEMRRVTRLQTLVLTFDPEALHEFWNVHYFPELVEVERRRYPSMEEITTGLGGNCTIIKVPVPLDCTDGFQEAFYGRPEAFLDPGVRAAQSAWGFLPEGLEAKLAATLAEELNSGAWDRKYGYLRRQPEFTGALRLIVSRP